MEAGNIAANSSHPTMKIAKPKPENTTAPFFDWRQNAMIPANSTISIIDSNVAHNTHLNVLR